MPTAEVSSPPEPSKTPQPEEKEPLVCEIASGFPDSIQQWCELISFWAKERDLDANLIAALILVESGGNPKAISSCGAVGLMQVMPRDGLAQKLYGSMFASRPTTQELLDPKYNIEYGTGMLANLIAKYGEKDGLKRYGPSRSDYSYVTLIYNTRRKYTSSESWFWWLHLP